MMTRLMSDEAEIGAVASVWLQKQCDIFALSRFTTIQSRNLVIGLPFQLETKEIFEVFIVAW